MIYPERYDDTIRLSALIEMAGKYRDSQVILVDRASGRRQCITAAAFIDGMVMLSVATEATAMQWPG